VGTNLEEKKGDRMIDSFRENLKNMPLLIGGIFLSYIAVVDETLFNAVTTSNLHNRLIVTLGTTFAASVPMFFAVGMIKQSILTGRETIYYYEKLLKGKMFWIMALILLVSISILIYLQGRAHSINGSIIMAGCILLSLYLIKFVKDL